MGVTTTNGVAVIAAGKKRSEQNHALLDSEFGGDRFRLPYHRTAPHGALRLIRFANGGCGTASQLLSLAYRCPGLPGDLVSPRPVVFATLDESVHGRYRHE
jgi:hypothetical protein